MKYNLVSIIDKEFKNKGLARFSINNIKQLGIIQESNFPELEWLNFDSIRLDNDNNPIVKLIHRETHAPFYLRYDSNSMSIYSHANLFNISVNDSFYDKCFFVYGNDIIFFGFSNIDGFSKMITIKIYIDAALETTILRDERFLSHLLPEYKKTIVVDSKDPNYEYFDIDSKYLENRRIIDSKEISRSELFYELRKCCCEIVNNYRKERESLQYKKTI